MTELGAQVRITDALGRQAGGRGYPAYRVIFNPRPRDLGIAPDYLTSAYRVDGPTRTVLSRSRRRPTRKGRFRIPRDAPAGVYMVLIFDGGEGGAHNTWDYLHVVDADGPNLGVAAARDTDGAAGSEASPPRASTSARDRSGSERSTDPATGWVPWAAGLVALLVSAWVVVRLRRRDRRTVA